METQDAINEQEWNRPDNWRGRLGNYSSTRDTRLWVPKRKPRLGWTINFAHPASWWTCLGLFTVPIAFILLFVLVQIARLH